MSIYAKTMLALGVGAMFVIIFSVSTPPAFAKPPKPKQVKIKKTKAGGRGCPEGTYSILVTASRPNGPADFIEVIYDVFSVEKGPGIPRQERRKACTIELEVEIPANVRFTIIDVHHEGYAYIPRHEKGTLDNDYFFPRFSNHVSKKITIDGFFDGTFSKDDSLGFSTPMWSPCGKNIPLNIKSTMALNGPPQSQATMTVDLVTGILRQKWAMQWQSCGP